MTNDELRLEIAKAKGWRFYESHPSPLNHTVPHFQASLGIIGPNEVRDNKYWTDEFLDEWPSDWSNLYGAGDIPDWPTDIRAAWELVEEMYAANTHVEISCRFKSNVDTEINNGNYFNDCWRVNFSEFGHWDRVNFFTADTAARAICLAWLKWKGEK